MKLIYHSKSSLESGISPFVATLAEFEGADPLCIACPYIGFSFFASLVNRAEQWRLVTDIGEWLASTPTKQLSLVHRLIKIETGRIRHFPGIHAKVFWRPERALIGSANLTEMGLLSRTEFGVELTAEEDGNELQEIHDWYEWIWSRSTPALNVNLGLIMFARSESPAFALNEKRRRAALEGISQAGELGISPLSALSKNRFSSPQRLKKAVAAGVDRTVVEKVVGVSLDIESPVQKSPSSRPIFIELDTCASVEDQIVFKVLQAVKLLGNTLDRERGFLMSEISGVLDEQIGGLSFHDLYFALIHSTANNPRGAFTTDSRFVLWVDGNGYFHEGSGPIAQSAVVDTLLALVTSSLSKTGTLSLSEVNL